MLYNQKPKDLGTLQIQCDEMMFYQYLPIKLSGEIDNVAEKRLHCFTPFVTACCNDFISEFGNWEYANSYVYLTAKRLYQGEGYSFNRKGYHSDGFMTDDINYLWSDANPTIFNSTDFDLTLDDNISMVEMQEQAKKENEYSYPPCSILRLNQYVIHKVSEQNLEGVRTFLKLSFSSDKYDLKGNSINPLLDYNWEMRERRSSRNIPQKLEK